jgi:hypothetical protein
MTAAAACAILSLSYSVLPSATNSSCGGDQSLVGLTLSDGRTILISAPPARIEAFANERYRALDGAVVRIETLARETFAAGMSAPFANAYGQLPGFADWTYSWIGNYIFSYQILYAASRAAGAGAITGGSIAPAAKKAVAAAVTGEFEARVLMPARVAQHIEIALADARALVYDEIERAFQRERAAWEEFAADSCPLGAPAPAAQQIAIGGVLIPSDRDPPTAQVDLNGDVAKIFTVRALRPFVVRVSIPTLAALGIGGASGVGAGLVIGAGVVWSLDYVANTIDAEMNRSKLELLLVSQLRAEELRLAAEAGGLLRAGLDAGTAGYRDGLAALANVSSVARRSAHESPILAPTLPSR